MIWLAVLFTGNGLEAEYVHPDPFETISQCTAHFERWKATQDFTDLANFELGQAVDYVFVSLCQTEKSLTNAGFDIPNVRKIESLEKHRE